MRTTNTLTHVFYCSHDIDGVTCWEGFDDKEARDEHVRTAHPVLVAELARAKEIRAKRAAGELNPYSQVVGAQMEAPRREYGTGKGGGSAQRGPTEKQEAFIRSLRAERGIDDDTMPKSVGAASKEIERLLAMPKTPKAPIKTERKANNAKLPDVPAGHYAIDTKPGAANTVAFYRVDRPEKGNWAGYTFVKRMVGGRPDERVPFRQTADILGRIKEAGIQEAGFRYGREIGRCCACNRTLTNDESRALGIGPECRNK